MTQIACVFIIQRASESSILEYISKFRILEPRIFFLKSEIFFKIRYFKGKFYILEDKIYILGILSWTNHLF